MSNTEETLPARSEDDIVKMNEELEKKLSENNKEIEKVKQLSIDPSIAIRDNESVISDMMKSGLTRENAENLAKELLLKIFVERVDISRVNDKSLMGIIGKIKELCEGYIEKKGWNSPEVVFEIRDLVNEVYKD